MAEIEIVPGEKPPMESDGAPKKVDENAPFKSGEESRPEWLPEKFFNEGKPQYEALANSYAELSTKFTAKRDEIVSEVREELASNSNRPETADLYELPGEMPDFVNADEMKTHPITEWWRAHAFEKGYSNEEFQAGIAQFIEAQGNQGVDSAAEVKALGDNATARLTAAGLWVTNTITDPGELEAIHTIAQTANGVRLIERLMKMNGEYKPGSEDGGGAPSEPEVTKADIELLMSKPEYWNPQRRDPAVVKKVEDWFKANS